MKRLTNFIPIFILLSVIGLGIGGFFYYQYNKAQKEIQSLKTGLPSPSGGDEVKSLVAEVGKLIELPSGEDPTIATITDINKLKDQPFFSTAKDGDKVLIYTNAKKAYLYDPNLKKVVDVAPLNISSSSAQLAQIKVVLRNGTGVNNLTTKVETQLKKSLPQVEVIGKDNATRSNFDKTIVVALTDGVKDQAKQLAKALNSQTGDLPIGETKPTSGDILIILGKDQVK